MQKFHKKSFRQYFCMFFILFLFIISNCACGTYFPDTEHAINNLEESDLNETIQGDALLPETSDEQPDLPAESEPEPEPVFEEYDIKLMMVGDNLMHMGIVNSGRQADGTYDYSLLFEGISAYLDAADIKIINQETILGGNELGFSGFPYFNSPTEVGDTIAAAGFNVVLHASNHAADQKIKGLENCAAFWEKYPEVLMLGIQGSDSVSDSDLSGQQTDTVNVHDRIGYLTIDDFTFAILNYTYGPNMETLPSSIKGHLNMLCAYNKGGAIDFTSLNPQVLKDIALAKETADYVIVCPHWGTEYVTTPSKYQKKFAKQMAEAGADIIIGTHPHVVQPVEWIETEDGRRTLCYYSLGNYVSTQKKTVNMLEGMAWIQFHVTEDGITLDEKQTGIVPLVCHYSSGPVRFEYVALLKDYTEEQAEKHGIRQYGGVSLTLSDLQNLSDEILGDFIFYPAP